MDEQKVLNLTSASQGISDIYDINNLLLYNTMFDVAGQPFIFKWLKQKKFIHHIFLGWQWFGRSYNCYQKRCDNQSLSILRGNNTNFKATQLFDVSGDPCI